MFEVGKKYKRPYDDIIYECIFVGDYRVFLRGNNTEVAPLKTNFRDSWKEYKEPQKITLYLGFYHSTLKDRLYTTGRLFSNKENIPLTNDGDSLDGFHEIVYEEKLK